MAKLKLDKQEQALNQLTARIAEDMAAGREITFSQRQEYNTLKKIVSAAGRTHPGFI